MLLKREESNYSKKGGEYTLLNKNAMKKTSQVLALTMLLMVFMPIIAFASNIFSGITYDGNNVSGSVYSNTYTPDGVTIKVYGPDKLQVIGAATATYSTYDVTSGVYKYTLAPFLLGSTVYSHVYLNAPSISTSVYEDAVYDITAPIWTSGTLTATNIVATSLTLNWSGASDNKGVTSYNVYQDSVLIASNVSGTTYTVSGLQAGVTYPFTVQAVDAAGNVSVVGPSASFSTATNQSSNMPTLDRIYFKSSSSSTDATVSRYGVTVGGSVSAQVYAVYSDLTKVNVTSFASYSSDNTSIVTINSLGKFTTLAQGTTVINATYDSKSASVGLDVFPVVSSIAVDSSSYSLNVGGTHNTTVTATFPDQTTANVTSNSWYFTNNRSIATVSSAGVVTAVGTGSTVIDVIYGSKIIRVAVAVTTSDSTCTSGCGSSTPTGPPKEIEITVGNQIAKEALEKAFAGNDNVTITVKGDSASLSAAGLIEAAKKAGTSVTITSDNGTYVLPLSLLKLEDLAKSLGIAVTELKIKVSITKVSGTTATAVADGVKAIGATSLTDAIDFKVTAEDKDGKSVEINGFGNTYVSRNVTIGKSVDMKKVTGVLYNEVTKKYSFVPATFETKDGKTVATLKRNGNSIYTVVEINKNFTDIASHWSKDDVSLLANKLVIDGATDTTFAPDRNITRAEFAALVVRSLGLNTDTTSTTFTDVKSSDWYAGAVAAAAGAKIINGYEDGSFKANAQITREELASMVVRALTFAGVKSDLSATQQAALLAKFTDASQIVWAKGEIAAAINAGVINGLTDTTIGSSKQATRAEAAVMLKRFLTKAGFIN
ncbi:S-layer homology domain-containing protein [Paenibacillus sp. Soil787]|uniref:S-layer homology domain-containing protein n=1 Tax=Paenibacillus sp. Soil787 TaxID=1736411 RepID=UPI0006F5258A|nr:S-layer homology domain-containing protein [Paenibacillus sp. Soil787]KRF39112.1 hypothetical protein ASG93_23385 [Paenibacillus sp. Soil787]